MSKQAATCSIDGCDKRRVGRGLCDKHYWRLRKHGDPNKLVYAPDGSGCVVYGYRLLTVEGKLVREHRKIMQEILGRPLAPAEVVHHKNGNRLDNRPENLEVMTRSEHTALHHAQRPVCSKGHPQTPENRVHYPSGSRKCRLCENEGQRARRRQRQQAGR